jgi:hypothetical protein
MDSLQPFGGGAFTSVLAFEIWPADCQALANIIRGANL